jgi:hypothetical protein
MSIIKVVKVQTNQVEAGMPDTLGFSISTHSDSWEFNYVANVTLDTSSMSPSDAATVAAFLDIVNSAIV